MTKSEKTALFFLRISLGWFFFYSGITKILDPAWSAGGYLSSAKNFAGFYSWLASPGMLPITNSVNEWLQLLIGISLILGLGVRLSSFFGAGLMLLYYFPILDFPYPDPHSFIVDQHVIYFFVLLVLGLGRAGRIFGLDEKFAWGRHWLG